MPKKELDPNTVNMSAVGFGVEEPSAPITADSEESAVAELQELGFSLYDLKIVKRATKKTPGKEINKKNGAVKLVADRVEGESFVEILTKVKAA